VDELASELSLTDNAIRTHLATLERDGFVRQRGVRRVGVGKPAYAYDVTSAVEQFFPKPYAAVLGALLDALDRRMPPAELEVLLRDIGRHIAAQHASAQGTLRDRLETASAALTQLGGLAEVEERDGTLGIRGYSCPLAALVPNHPAVCRLAETFVSAVAGVPVRECCDSDPTLRCRFEVPTSP
jgi:predicted ArsR family transcriptional regulator